MLKLNAPSIFFFLIIIIQKRCHSVASQGAATATLDTQPIMIVYLALPHVDIGVLPYQPDINVMSPTMSSTHKYKYHINYHVNIL